MKTIDYARQELNKYYYLVTGVKENEIILKVQDVVKKYDDEIKIDIKKGKGIIEGSNERSVLIGVYKFFYEMGCRFFRPGKDGEKIVRRTLEECNVIKEYKPSLRYRAICSEGAISEENILDFVEWLPKVGMNSYFTQFFDGHLFFEKWYKHKDSSVLRAENYSVAESRRHYKNVVEKIKECGLIYQAVGHGWTTEPLGYVTYGDTCSKEDDILPEHAELFALVNGKRTFFESPGNTQLCYSNPRARNVITDGIVKHLKEHKEIDILHFWLADSINNHCECENCKKMMPSEWYVMMLNELDDKLTEEGIDTKIVFLIYCDLLFAPQKVKLNNPDRFIMMYAPIARDFFNPLFTEENLLKGIDAPSYVRNKNHHPTTSGEYLYYLKGWQEQIKCDSFSFDYHLMTFLCGGEQGGEPSGTRISRTIYEDMKGLKTVGLNGNVSCQLQRTFTPTALPNYVMAETLFGTVRSFDEIEDEYFIAAFGEQSEKIKSLLHNFEYFYLTDFIKEKKDISANKQKIIEFINYFNTAIDDIKYLDDKHEVACSLSILKYFIALQKKFLQALLLKANEKDIQVEIQEIKSFVDESELNIQRFDDCLFRKEGVLSWLNSSERNDYQKKIAQKGEEK